jgi:tetratricopeptide (TPR) repeat protein
MMDIANLSQLAQKVQDLQQAPVPSAQHVDMLVELARAYDSTDVQKGIEVAQSASVLARFLRYPQGEADSMIELSWLLIRSGRLEDAFLQVQHADYIAHQINDAGRRAKCQHIMAAVHHEAGNYPKAESLWQSLLALAREAGHRSREADYLTALGILRQDQSDLALAYEYKRKAHDIYIELDDPYKVISLNNLAYLLTRMGRHAEALAFANDALQRCPAENMAWRSTILDTLGLIHVHLQHHAQARKLLVESITLAQQAGAQKQQAVRSLMDLSKLEWECHNRPAACEYLIRALEIAKSIKSVKLQSQAHQTLYRYYLQMKAYEAALRHHERYLECDHELGCRKMEKQVQLMRANATVIALRNEWARDSQAWLNAA